MKASIKETEFFKMWLYGNMRILQDKATKSFYPYEVQKYNGITWDKVKVYHTLDEAKAIIKQTNWGNR